MIETNDNLSQRLFAGVFPTGIGYADRQIEEDGDYARVAHLFFDTLELEIYRPKSPLLDLIKADAARIIAMRGQRYQTSSTGQGVILGSKL